ncbi:MAG: hypothetical protein [Bacteriophage sp.]|jgi:hypothetical protein|nr:MAG: hypothetical protein [Bacteriophage sp.]UVY44139.1 MAG: hypothetical protein [Bacteriophage sp.]UWH93793.1 MAG: hypothetical protein [Bacteriophage sp.]UWI08199.1 MAG: hypothetical protein [Bacteriophage sp.]
MKITKKIKNSRFFMEPGIAEISAGYANNVKYCQELRICLSVHDWSKFVNQPFFRELIEYLDRIQIQGNIDSLDLDKEK